jgi:hypothetical protein
MLWIMFSITCFEKLGEVAMFNFKRGKLTVLLRFALRNSNRKFAAPVTLLLSIFSFTATAQVSQSVAEFEAWGVFKDDMACWIASNPQNAFDSSLDLAQQYLHVTFFYGSHVPEVSFLTTNCCAEAVSVHTEDYTIPLFLYGDTYFLTSVDDLDFLMSVLQKDRVNIIGDSSRTQFMSFTTQGLQEAYNEVSRICEFRPSNFLQDAEGLYKG